ncbi:MAG: Stp1/IreP family PP2C-type Ser/Thr phosphatase [Lachnospiraceae bacterium]|nr:Stp1/IreP family PP2C-type Ser/Thr phosphatase [Lachnospiraceae bacterium]
MIFYAITDTGRERATNQDYVFASDAETGVLHNLFIVADGMGGHKAGEYASENTVKTVLEEIRSKKEEEPVAAIEKAISRTNQVIYRIASEDESKAGMGTTIVVATVFDGHLYVANVGDSRLYVVEEDHLRQVTKDHSVVEELIRRGAIKPSSTNLYPDYKHKITRAVGAEPDVRVDFFDVPASDVQQVLMCTDGLTNMLSDEEIESIMLSDEKVKQKAEMLVKRANEKGGKDNITLIAIDYRCEDED